MTLRVGSPFVRWFASIGVADRTAVGGKGASLGELDRAGVRVPPGFVVTTAAFERMLAMLDIDGSVRQRIASLDLHDAPGVKNACTEIRERIDSAPFPPELHAVLVEAYRELNERERDVPVAVRSSTTEESTDAMPSGLQDTYLWVRGLEGVAHCVKSCWASLYSVESVTHRLQSRISEQSVAMGVVIQRMVNAHCSGVMLTRSPAADDRTVVTIEGSWGLGSSIASGEVTPDQFIVSKVTGELLSRTLADKGVQHLPDTIAGGVRREPVPDELRSVQCLTDAQIAELAQVAKRVERHYGSAQVIDWAIAQGERGVYLLQTRAEQAWPQRETARNTQRKPAASDPVVSFLSGRRR